MSAPHAAVAAAISAIARLRRRYTAESASRAPITPAGIAPPTVSLTCEAHTKSTASRTQTIAQTEGHWNIATAPKCRAGIIAGVNDGVMVAFVMISDPASS